MRNDHIINLLEERPPGGLSAAEIERINAHTAECAECLRAFEASLVSSRLLRERAAAIVEPAPFFQTRVLAAIRERGLAPEPFGFPKLWQAARALITSMAAVVLMLAALTFLISQPDSPEMASGSDVEAAEWAVFDGAADDMTYSQVLTNLYDQEAEGVYGRER